MTGPSGLQFDKVEGGGKGMACSMCGAGIPDQFYHVNGKPVCASCKAKAEAQFAALKASGGSPGAMTRAVIFGAVAAIAGAIVYFGVAAITGFELGLVSIVIGYMVGWAIRRATGGFGDQRYQILAVALTYLSICLAYAPNALAHNANIIDLLVRPISSIIGRLSTGSGIIGLIIIAAGLRQAWRMTGPVDMKISGPYKIGGARAAAT